MSKMMKAEVKVVRFGCADVIATSSLLTNGVNYYTLGAELNQSKNYTADVEKVYIDLSPYSFKYNDGTEDVLLGVPDNSYCYAWYRQSDGKWYTQGVPFSSSAKHEWNNYVGDESYH